MIQHHILLYIRATSPYTQNKNTLIIFLKYNEEEEEEVGLIIFVYIKLYIYSGELNYEDGG